jgi:hypothetical protein
LSQFIPLLTSSPIHFNETDTIIESSSDSESSSNSLQLYRHSDISVSSFSNEFNSIVRGHNISDAASTALLSLFSKTLPIPNACPNFYQFQRAYTKDFHELCTTISSNEGEYFVLSLKFQFEKIIKNYPGIFDSTHMQRKENSFCDIYDGTCFPELQNNDQTLFLTLTLDGVRPVHTSKNYNMWPVMLSVLNLPPFKRRMQCNLVLAVLFYGKTKPPSQMILQYALENISNFAKQEQKFQIKIVQVVADLPAKASILNMTQFNGYYGCSVCTSIGHYDKQAHSMLYPIFDGPIKLRDEETHWEHVRVAELNNQIVFGVKGKSVLQTILPTPINFPLDCMHLVYLGVTRSLVNHICTHGLVNDTLISAFITNIQLPASFKRKPRSLEYRTYFKAQEWKFLLLYALPVSLFLANTDSKVCLLTLLLSSAVYSMSTRCVPRSNVSNSRSLLSAFHQLLIQLFGQKSLSYSIHALSHLPLMVSLYFFIN